MTKKMQAYKAVEEAYTNAPDSNSREANEAAHRAVEWAAGEEWDNALRAAQEAADTDEVYGPLLAAVQAARG